MLLFLPFWAFVSVFSSYALLEHLRARCFEGKQLEWVHDNTTYQ